MPNKDIHITFIQAGGTIDKDYPRGEDNHGYTFWVRDPAVKSILPSAHVSFSYDVLEVVKKDSLDITEGDRKKILDAVTDAQSSRIVITHGTDTLLTTAQLVAENNKDKTVVFTGSLLPDKFTNSDARFNIGMAVAAAQLKTPGVYVALYGRVVPWNEFKPIEELHDIEELT